MSNITEIARQAGVSRSTVSRVLNQHPHVHEATRARVLQIIEELDYIQNSNAVQLKKGKTNTIGVISPSISHYFMQMLRGITEAGTKQNYQTLLYQTNDKTEQELNALELLRQKRLDGLIILRRSLPWSKIETYTKYGPIMTCEPLQHPEIDSIYMNHYEGFRLGIEHLISLGYQRIACTIGRSDSRNSLERKKAFHEVLQQHKLPIREDWIVAGTFDIQDGRRSFHQLHHYGMPDAVMHASDYVAAGFIAEAKEHGLHIPKQLGVVGFESDDNGIADLMGLTHVRNPLKGIGSEAFSRLYAKLTNSPYTVQELSFSLEVRESTGHDHQ